MAKKKAKKQSKGTQPLSPERFLREKARALPLGSTYMSYERGDGLATVMITRNRPSGNKAVVLFLVDTFCLGVKDVVFRLNLTPEEYDEYLKGNIERFGLSEVTYPEAHNIIYGAIEWAGEAEIMPCREWVLAQYMLEPDTDDVPYVDFEFGDKGKYHLIVTARKEEAYLIPSLKARLGDNFDYTVCIEGTEYSDADEAENDWKDDEELPTEPYEYQHPAYPAKLDVKHPFIAEALLDPANVFGLPEEVRKQIMALPPDEAAHDIAQVILYTIGDTYEAIETDEDAAVENNAICLGVAMLAVIDSSEALPALLELTRQSFSFMEAHLGDTVDDFLPQAIYREAKGNYQPIMELLRKPGLDGFNRLALADALAYAYVNEPEQRPQVTDLLRELLLFMKPRLAKTDACDAEYAGLFIAMLSDLRIQSLLPEIKELFDTGFVNRFTCGDYHYVEHSITSVESNDHMKKYQVKTLEQIQEDFNHMRRISEESALG